MIRTRRVLRPGRGDPGTLLPEDDPRYGRMPYPRAAPGGLDAGAWLSAAARPGWGGAGGALLPLTPAIAALVAPGWVALLVALLLLAAGALLATQGAAWRAARRRDAAAALHGPVWDRLLALAPPAFARISPAALRARVAQALRAGGDAVDRATQAPSLWLQCAGGLGVLALAAPWSAAVAALLLALLAAPIGHLAERAARAQDIAARRREAAEADVVTLVPHLVELRALGALGWARRRSLRAQRGLWRSAARHEAAWLTRETALLAVPALLAALVLMLPAGNPAAAALAALAAGHAAARLAADPRRHRAARLAAFGRSIGPGAPADRVGGADPGRFALLEARSLRFTWPGAREPALDGLSFTLRRGEVLAVAGPSGGGKSTLVRLMLGLMPIQSGALRLNGHDIAALDPQAIRRSFGAVMQDQALPFTTIRGAVRGSRRLDEGAITRALDRAGLTEAVAALPMGGQTLMQEGAFPASLFGHLLIARALATEPDLLILDEIFAALGVQDAAALLARWRAEGLTVVFCAHDPALVALADRVVRLEGALAGAGGGDAGGQSAGSA